MQQSVDTKYTIHASKKARSYIFPPQNWPTNNTVYVSHSVLSSYHHSIFSRSKGDILTVIIVKAKWDIEVAITAHIIYTMI